MKKKRTKVNKKGKNCRKKHRQIMEEIKKEKRRRRIKKHKHDKTEKIKQECIQSQSGKFTRQSHKHKAKID